MEPNLSKSQKVLAMLLPSEHRRCSRGVYFVNRSGTINGYTCNHLIKKAKMPKRRQLRMNRKLLMPGSRGVYQKMHVNLTAVLIVAKICTKHFSSCNSICCLKHLTSGTFTLLLFHRKWQLRKIYAPASLHCISFFRQHASVYCSIS